MRCSPMYEDLSFEPLQVRQILRKHETLGMLGSRVGYSQDTRVKSPVYDCGTLAPLHP
jgi:hypothetical protein